MPRFDFRMAAVIAALGTPFALHFFAPGSAPSQGEAARAAVSATDVQADTTLAPAPAPAAGTNAAGEAQAAKQKAFADGNQALRQTINSFLQQYEPSGGTLPTVTAPPVPLPASKSRVLLAIVPDPVHTQLALRFDRSIDDLQDAAQAHDWELGAYWMPWDPRTHKDPDRFQDHLDDQNLRQGRQQNPGVLLFRRRSELASPNPGPLIVLLVADTPTTGVNSAQFKEAVHIWRSFAPNSVNGNSLQILGPTFSGSVQSLKHLLQDEFSSNAPARLSIASGTVTNGSLLNELNTISVPHSPIISFALDGEYQRNALRQFLADTQGAGPRFAELRESETSYGSSFDQTGKATSATPATRPDPWLVLRYPRGISRLRRAYEQNSIIGFGSAASSGPRSELRFVTSESEQGNDTPPSFSGPQETLAMETEMAQITTALDEEHISVVALSATDVFDEIFVARYLQQRAPRVTVILEDADVLFLRKGDDAGLDHFYVLTPWPLIAANRRWTGFDTSELLSLYQSQGDQGAQAAAAYLLSCPPYGPAAPNSTACTAGSNSIPPIGEYRTPVAIKKDSTHPPIWLSVIGHGHFAPISLIDVDHPAGGTSSPNLSALQFPVFKSNPVRPSAPLQTKLLAALLVGLLLWHGAAIALSRLDRRFAWVYALAEAEHHQRRLYVQAFLSFLAIPAICLLYVPAQEGFTEYGGDLPLCLVALAILAAGLVCYPILLRTASSLPAQPSHRQLLARITGMMTLLLFAAWAIYHAIWFLISPPVAHLSESTFFRYRSALMLPGISPTLPLLLLLAACACWVHSHFARFAFFGHRIPELPTGHDDIDCPSPAQASPITDLFSNYSGKNIFIGAIAFVVVLIAFMISERFGPASLENGRFDIAVRVLAILVASTILHDVGVAVWGWHQLHELVLLRLKRSPLRWGFTWIKGFSWRRLWTGTRVLTPESIFDYMSRMTEINRRTGWNPGITAAYKAIEAEFGNGPINLPQEQWADNLAQKVLCLHADLASTAAARITDLGTLWQQDHGPVTGHDEAERGMYLHQEIKDLKDDTRTAALDRMASEEFVALLYLGYVRMVLIQLRSRILSASGCYILLLWGLTSYPWMNHHAIILALSVLLIVISAAVIYIYSGMHRDDILSRTTETTPGKLESAFFIKTLTTIGIPLLTLVASQVPEFSDVIFSWIEPGLRGH